MDFLLIAATVFGAAACTVFVAVYATRPWWRSHMGRSIMLKDVALALLAWVAILKRVDELLPSLDLWHVLVPLVAFGWTCVGLAMTYRTIVVWRLGDRDEEGEP